jgi:gliding motility-associated-like protein
MKKIVFVALFFFLSNSFSQITVQNTQTPTQLVQNILLGNGILSSNIKYNGSSIDALSVQHNVASFNSVGTNFTINDGLLLTTGYADIAAGPNTNLVNDINVSNPYKDPDLDSLSSAPITNGAVIEFDFQAISDTFSFKYIFASEEYNEYVGFPYNDVFGFFLSGPGVNGTFSNNGINLARLPTTTSTSNIVSINNVNIGNNNANSLFGVYPPTNSNYFINNDQSQAYGNAIQYDGSTILMSSGAKLICGQTYHIKIGITNVQDQQYGSAVFIKSKSFSSDELSFSMPSNFNGVLLEKCSLGNHLIELTRPANQSSNSLTINLSYTGTATTSLDYQTLPTSLTFSPNQTSISTPINIITDNLTEGVEYILINANYSNSCNHPISLIDTLFIGDPIPLITNTPNYTYYCPDFNTHVNVTSGMAPYTYLWFNNSTNDSISISTSLPNQINYFTVAVTDACGNTTIDTSIITYLPVVSDFSATPIVAAVNANITFTNLSQNATSYDWNFGNGLSNSVNSNINQSSLYSNMGNYTIQLIAFNGSCSDTSYRTITIGDYPVVIPSNVFTPNGDGENDLFYFNVELIKSLDLTILNRWGAVIFEESSSNPKWNGKDLKGEDLADGVYFYKYTANGFIGDPITGSGYIHLIRN